MATLCAPPSPFRTWSWLHYVCPPFRTWSWLHYVPPPPSPPFLELDHGYIMCAPPPPPPPLLELDHGYIMCAPLSELDHGYNMCPPPSPPFLELDHGYIMCAPPPSTFRTWSWLHYVCPHFRTWSWLHYVRPNPAPWASQTGGPCEKESVTGLTTCSLCPKGSSPFFTGSTPQVLSSNPIRS